MDVRRELSTQAQSCLPCNRIACIDKVYGPFRLLAYLPFNVLRDVLRDVLCSEGVVCAAQNDGVNALYFRIFGAK